MLVSSQARVFYTGHLIQQIHNMLLHISNYNMVSTAPHVMLSTLKSNSSSPQVSQMTELLILSLREMYHV